MHQEHTFIVKVPLSLCDMILGQCGPHDYPQGVGDLAKSWQVSNDHLTHTFTLHEGVKVHDGSGLTSADVKASWDKVE
jgi:ABC-type transport system substrate-binding protein